MHTFPSEGWTEAYRTAVNNNVAYREASRDWDHGDVALVVETGGLGGLPPHVGAVLGVAHGHCSKAMYVTSLEAAKAAAFVIVADYDTWRRVIGGELDPVDGMLSGELDLIQGSLPTMIRYVEGSRELVSSARQVPTDFVQS